MKPHYTNTNNPIDFPKSENKMNERILELARQVWPDPNISHVNHMKFAELLIRECATIAEQAEPYRANDLILKHFGVEE